ncbi:hypothetical protein NPIL_554951, partial [Nephila pilipes]
MIRTGLGRMGFQDGTWVWIGYFCGDAIGWDGFCRGRLFIVAG